VGAFKGGKGNDALDAADGIAGNDTVDGGGDADTCAADPGDTKANCEA
jgi:hypothetical protein